MKPHEQRMIYLSVDRQEQMVPVDNIIYAQVTDKLCSIFLTQGQPIRIFLTLANLLGMLPREGFLQISRNCLVSVQYMRNITERSVVMIDGTELHYTIKKKPAILFAFQQSLTERARRHDAVSWKLDFASEFRCFDHSPAPFIVLEIMSESSQAEPHFMCRYANEAMAALRRTPLGRLIGTKLTPSQAFSEQKYIPYFADIAFNGRTRSWTAMHADMETQLHIFCYQPHYGFCACLILPMPQKTASYLAEDVM